MDKIVVKSLDEQVAHQIRQMIHQGDLERGAKINEKELCATMGVSRTPVREALRMLSSEGLIELIPHKGAFVSEPSLEDIRNVFEVLSVLEGMCARLSTERMTGERLERIESLHRELESSYEKLDHESYLDANVRYHALLQEFTGNRILDDVVSGLRQRTLLYRYQQLYEPERFEQSILEHRELLEAFRRKDPEAAKKCMKQHLMNQCNALLKLHAYQHREDDQPGKEGEA